MSETQGLKACPFCGGEAIVRHGKRNMFYPECTECEATPRAWFTAETAAITAWNTRPREAELEAALEEAKGALEEIATQYKGPASYQIIARYALTRIRAAKGGGDG